MLVSKAGISGSTDKALFGQLGAYPAALGVASFLAFVARAPARHADACRSWRSRCSPGAAAWKVNAEEGEGHARRGRGQASAPRRRPRKSRSTAALQIDQIRLELGYGLLALINSDHGTRLTDQVSALRRSSRSEMGFVMPSVRIQDNLQLSGQHLCHPHQGDRGRARRARPEHAAGHGSRAASRSRCPARPPPSRPSACRRNGSPESHPRGSDRSAATPWSSRRPSSPRT